jgi:hypothetical protein
MTETTRVTGSLARRAGFRRRAYHNVAWRLLQGSRGAAAPPFAAHTMLPLRHALGFATFVAPRQKR